MDNKFLLMEDINWSEKLLGETLLFSLLGKLLYTVPDRNWLVSLYQDDVFIESPFASEHPDVIHGLTLLRGWGNHPGGITQEKIGELVIDNTHLFVGPGKVVAPLWESVYFTKERLIFQESTLDVRNWYRRFGLEPDNIYKEPDDHIALEIEFIACLANRALQALEASDLDTCEELLQAQRQFFSQHLLRWAFRWSQLVRENARTDFYRGLADLLDGAVSELALVLNLECPVELAR